MLKKKISLLLATVMTFSVLSTGFSKEIVTHAETTITEEKQTYTDRVYLSDLQYSKASAYGTVKNDTNSSDVKIRLKVTGGYVTFNKGLFAHASSDIIYDVESQISKGFDTFIAYAGVDASQGGKGNVKFIISVSEDNKTWTPIQTTEPVTSSSNSIKIQEKLPQGTKYLRLQADPNGSNGNDHAVYGDAALVGYDYLNIKMPESMKSVADLDKEIIAIGGSAMGIATSYGHKLYQREFIKRVDYDVLTRTFRDEPQYAESISYLFENEKALAYFIETGVGDSGDSYVTVLKNFDLIYKKYKDEIKKDDFLLKLAVTTSWAFAKNVYFWANHYEAQNVVERFEIYKDFVTVTDQDWSWKQSEIDFFKKQSPAMLKYTLNTRQNNDEIKWFADYIKNVKNGSMNGYHYVEYKGVASFTQPQYYGKENFNTWNEKYNLSKYNINTDNSSKVRWYVVMEVDGVCGAIAKTYTALQETFGRPSGVLNQPGHAASLICNDKGEWSIVNDVSGWAHSRDEMGQMPLAWGMQSWNSNRSASYITLTQNVLDNYENYQMATKLNILADTYRSKQINREFILSKAIEVQPNNLDSMYNLIQAYKSDNTKTSKGYIELARKVTENFKYYPLAMVDLLAQIQPNIGEAEIPLFELIRTNALKDASAATDSDVKQPGIAKTMARYLLNSNGSNKKVDTFSFSFSGDKANKLVVADKYSNTQFATRYSIDNGKTWTDTTDFPEIDLSSVAHQITEENDILIKILGANDIYKIDITKSDKPNNKTVVANDLENRLIGNIENLEYSVDHGKTWHNYTDSTRFDGDVVVKVRYKSHGVYLMSDESLFTFKANTDTDTRKYITINNINLNSFSSEQDKTTRAAKNMIDGNMNTFWHTAFKAENDGKFYTVEFTTPKYITSIEYVPNGSNGKLRDAEIQTSIDGQTWKVSGTAKDLADDGKTKVIDLDNPTEAKYVKIVAKQTWGVTVESRNRFFSGKAFLFFEDTTAGASKSQLTKEEMNEFESIIDGIKESEKVAEKPAVSDNNTDLTNKSQPSEEINKAVVSETENKDTTSKSQLSKEEMSEFEEIIGKIKATDN